MGFASGESPSKRMGFASWGFPLSRGFPSPSEWDSPQGASRLHSEWDSLQGSPLLQREWYSHQGDSLYTANGIRFKRFPFSTANGIRLNRVTLSKRMGFAPGGSPSPKRMGFASRGSPSRKQMSFAPKGHPLQANGIRIRGSPSPKRMGFASNVGPSCRKRPLSRDSSPRPRYSRHSLFQRVSPLCLSKWYSLQEILILPNNNVWVGGLWFSSTTHSFRASSREPLRSDLPPFQTVFWQEGRFALPEEVLRNPPHGEVVGIKSLVPLWWSPTSYQPRVGLEDSGLVSWIVETAGWLSDPLRP